MINNFNAKHGKKSPSLLFSASNGNPDILTSPTSSSSSSTSPSSSFSSSSFSFSSSSSFSPSSHSAPTLTRVFVMRIHCVVSFLYMPSGSAWSCSHRRNGSARQIVMRKGSVGQIVMRKGSVGQIVMRKRSVVLIVMRNSSQEFNSKNSGLLHCSNR